MGHTINSCCPSSKNLPSGLYQEVIDLSIPAMTDLTRTPPPYPQIGKAAWFCLANAFQTAVRQTMTEIGPGRSAIAQEAYDVRRLRHFPTVRDTHALLLLLCIVFLFLLLALADHYLSTIHKVASRTMFFIDLILNICLILPFL